MDDAEFRVLTARAGYRLDDEELADLKARFQAAMEVIWPLAEMDLGQEDLAVAFSPRAEPNGDRAEPNRDGS